MPWPVSETYPILPRLKDLCRDELDVGHLLKAAAYWKKAGLLGPQSRSPFSRCQTHGWITNGLPAPCPLHEGAIPPKP